MNMSDFISELTSDFNNDLIQLLEYELSINNKKLNGIPLTEKEYIFDTYFVKPSIIARTILERGKKNE